MVAYHTVLYEDGKYRFWYNIMLTDAAKEAFFPPGGGIQPAKRVLAYAESDDGLHWTKPGLEIYRLEGRPTNVVTPCCRESGVFRDPTAPASEHFKCFNFEKLPDSEGKPPHESYGLYGLVSPGGIHWSRIPDPLLSYFHDMEHVAAWDPILKKYVGYFRGHLDGRFIARSETDDFRNWTPAEVILAGGPQDSRRRLLHKRFHNLPGRPVAAVPFPGDLSPRHRPCGCPLRCKPQQSRVELDVPRPDP